MTKKMCPSPSGGNNFWPSAYSPKTKLMYIPALTACANVTRDTSMSIKTGDPTRMPGGVSKLIERYNTEFSAIDPLTGEVKAKTRHPVCELQRRAGDRRRPVVHRLHGRDIHGVRRRDMQPLWKINVGVGSPRRR